MPAPAITAATRTSFRGVGALLWCPSIANPASPTRTELNAGTNLVTQIVDGSGFGQEASQIDTPDAGSRVTTKIPGAIAIDDSSLTMYASLNGTDARQLMPRDAAGFIVIMQGGDVAGRKMDVYPVRVASVKKQYSFGGDAADTLVFSYSPSAQPSEDVTIPA